MPAKKKPTKAKAKSAPKVAPKVLTMKAKPDFAPKPKPTAEKKPCACMAVDVKADNSLAPCSNSRFI